MSKSIHILYAGDSGVHGPACYLLAILKSLGVKTRHVPPFKILTRKVLAEKFDAIILSDFSRRNMPPESEKAMIHQVHEGTGLMMVGGWGSFSGPFGGWKGSLTEKALPVLSSKGDDRLNFPGGAHISLVKSHPMFSGFSFKNPPAIVGMNDLHPKKNASVLLRLRRIRSSGNHLTLDKEGHPLLVVDRDPAKRIAAFASDFAPHWAGGMLDWGTKTVKLSVDKKTGIEVGNAYVEFISRIIRWLARMS